MGLVAAALALAGCGGSGGGDTSTAPALNATVTKAQFLKKAKAICAQGTAELGRLDVAAWKRYDPNNASEATRDKVALALLPARERELRRLRAVGLPKGSADYVNRMLTAWEEGIEKGKAHPRSLRETGYNFAFYEAYSMGNDYGLESCWLG
ncbi:MAG TPA: hypothetical protein VLC07_08250 [Solirubrobacterales bacterium]|nr:hypothetical protein [Solirubrobacterales bacterium]